MSNRIFSLRYYSNTAPINRNAVTDDSVGSVVTVFCKIKQQKMQKGAISVTEMQQPAEFMKNLGWKLYYKKMSCFNTSTLILSRGPI